MNLTDDSNRHQGTCGVEILQKNNSDLVGKEIIKFARESYQTLMSNLRHHKKRQKYVNIIRNSCIAS